MAEKALNAVIQKATHLGPLGSTILSATTPSMGHIPVRSSIRWVWSLAKTSLQKSESVRARLGGARL